MWSKASLSLMHASVATVETKTTQIAKQLFTLRKQKHRSIYSNETFQYDRINRVNANSLANRRLIEIVWFAEKASLLQNFIIASSVKRTWYTFYGQIDQWTFIWMEWTFSSSTRVYWDELMDVLTNNQNKLKKNKKQTNYHWILEWRKANQLFGISCCLLLTIWMSRFFLLVFLLSSAIHRYACCFFSSHVWWM